MRFPTTVCKRGSLALVALVPAMCALLATRSSADPWVAPPPGYRYEAAACPEAASPVRIYKPCEDQMAILAGALTAARREGKLLIVELGANWCPNCRELHPQLKAGNPAGVLAAGSDLGKIYDSVPIAVSLVGAGRTRAAPSGEAVLALLARQQPGVKLRGIPMLAIVDPAVEGKAFFRHVDDLVDRRTRSLDPKQLAQMLLAAERHLRAGEPAPAEPGRFWRLLRRFLH